MAKVFLSYRRVDSAQVAGRIYDELVAHCGRSNIFKDVDSISLGLDFREALADAVARCDVMLVIIGRNWLASADKDGKQRLENPSDLVRYEIESALARHIRIIPLLLDDASMPTSDELPNSLRALAFRNAAVIRPDPDFHRDMQRVIQSIGYLGGENVAAPPTRTVKAANLHPGIESGYQVRIASGPEAGSVCVLDKMRITIGRSSDCDIELKDPYCSRNHCALEWDGMQRVFVLNAFHPAGVILNGVQVRDRAKLTVGDRLAIGTTEMILEHAST